MRSLTELSETVIEFLRAIDAARMVLADAARTAAGEISALESGAGAVDVGLSAALGGPGMDMDGS